MRRKADTQGHGAELVTADQLAQEDHAIRNIKLTVDKKNPEQYARLVWLDEKTSRCVKVIAEMERRCLKSSQPCLSRGYSRYMDEFLYERAIRGGPSSKGCLISTM
ncbi:MAG: hypothetical protein HYX80_08280 [Chloroflexi bacterium]|nr:hypothetical protein [Chloroflexota bacterium]